MALNDIPVSMFIVLVLLQIIFMFIAFALYHKENPFGIFGAMLSTIFGLVNAAAILNKSVVYITDTGTTVVIQSLPVHYLLQGLAVFTGLTTLYFILLTIHNRLQEDKTMTKPIFGNWKYD